jgi:hypothetical protein
MARRRRLPWMLVGSVMVVAGVYACVEGAWSSGLLAMGIGLLIIGAHLAWAVQTTCQMENRDGRTRCRNPVRGHLRTCPRHRGMRLHKILQGLRGGRPAPAPAPRSRRPAPLAAAAGPIPVPGGPKDSRLVVVGTLFTIVTGSISTVTGTVQMITGLMGLDGSGG